MLAFRKGMQLWALPMRYWEPEYHIYPVTVLEDCTTDAQCVYADTPDDGPQYLTIRDRVFYTQANAQKAREHLTALYELRLDDDSHAYMEFALNAEVNDESA